MAGVVGGDVGNGRYAGQILGVDAVSQPGFTLLHARYELDGSRHSFIADLRIVEDMSRTPVTATIAGAVTSGWMKGAHVAGEFTILVPCPIPTPGNVAGTKCFQGTLHLQLRGGMYVTKECSENTGLAGTFCTLTTSNVPGITAGMKVIYELAWTADTVPWVSNILLTDGRGNTAFGQVSLNAGGNDGTVTLDGGTGRFHAFHAKAAVVWLGGADYAWDGTYRFGNDD
jgi:hypothetical protein